MVSKAAISGSLRRLLLGIAALLATSLSTLPAIAADATADCLAAAATLQSSSEPKVADAQPVITTCAPALLKAPDNTAIKAGLGRAYLLAGRQPEALPLLLSAADAGDVQAADQVGDLLLNGFGIERDAIKAFSYSVLAANAGIAEAQNRVGYMYAEGVGVPRVTSLALKWFQKAAAQGHPLAIKNVAELEAEAACAAAAASQYESGFFAIGRDLTAIDPAVAIPACQSAVDKDPGSDEDKAWLARAFLADGQTDAAMPLLESAAAGDSPLARQLLGDLLQAESGEAEYARSVELLEPAADAGFALAQLSLGYAYDRGLGVAEDDALAADWYRKAADQGVPRAMGNLGYLYHGGNGVLLDYGQALRWYERAADKGDIIGIYGVGQLYEFGQGVVQDYPRAAAQFEIGADMGDAYSQNDLGYLYDLGLGVEADAEKAVLYYQRAADQGYALAEANLAQLYATGKGVPQDFGKALELYTAAHDAGEVQGTNGLANAYLNGEGVGLDYATARDYAQQAADAGAVYGQTTLGYIYSEGLGVPRDFDKAIELYDLAAAQGDSYGTERAAEAQAEQLCGAETASRFEVGFESSGRLLSDIDPDTALPACEEAVRLDDASLENKFWLARALIQTGRSAEALPLLETAAEGAFVPGIVALADLLQGKDEVPADPARALLLYRQAALQGFAPAEFGLGMSYELGNGVPPDLVQAVKWYQWAADHGMAFAAARLDALQGAEPQPVTGPGRAGPSS